MTSWASVPRTRAPRADLSPSPATPAGVRSSALAVAGALFAASTATCLVPLLSDPVQAQEPAPAVPSVPAAAPAAAARTVAFDYSADVAPNDVYDTPRAQAPLPLFRALGERIDVEADYTGPAAFLSLQVRLSSTTGWSTAVPLADEVEVDGRGRVAATFDLRRLEDRAALVAQQTAMPFEGLTVELVAVVRDGSATWTPSVALALTPQQLRLTGEPSTLVVTQEASGDGTAALPAAAPTPQSRLDDLLGWRPGGLVTTVVLGLAMAGGSLVVRRREEEDDAARARRRLGRLLLDVAPADLAASRVVHVDAPDALARLAERYGLLVLHWTDEAGEVFVVHDDSTAYCYTTGEWPEPAPAEPPPASQTVRVEAERLERQRRDEADRAAQAWAAVERAYAAEVAGAAPERARPFVPAPRSGVPAAPRPTGPPDSTLAAGPPKQAEERALPASSYFEIG